MIKVLFLINTLGSGGAERILVETVNSLNHKKYQITVQTVLDGGVNKKQLSPKIAYKTIIPFKNEILQKLAVKFLVKMKASSLLYKLCVHDNYDYEIAFLEGLPTKILSKSTNTISKKYAWLHTDLNSFPDSYHAYGSEKKEEIAYRQFDRIFCVSESVRTNIESKYSINKDKLEVVYNVIDDKSISLASKELVTLPTQARPIFISVGRLTKTKGYERLLRVHKRLIESGYEHSLLLIGDGSEYAKLDKFINENNLLKTAFLLGYQDNPYKYISKADLFICSSFAEGYSTVVSEAVLCNTPVLSTEVAGAREPQCLPRCSIIVENNEDALFNALRYLLDNPKKLVDLRHNLSERQALLKKKFLLENFEQKVFK